MDRIVGRATIDSLDLGSCHGKLTLKIITEPSFLQRLAHFLPNLIVFLIGLLFVWISKR